MLALVTKPSPHTTQRNASTQHVYKVTLPTGKKVVQLHSPALATPKPTTPQPAAIIPVPAPAKTRAVDHAKGTAPVSHVAKVIAPRSSVKAAAKVTKTVAISTVEQFDSVTVSLIPTWAHYVAGYVNGIFHTYPLLIGKFKTVVGIAVSTSAGADCLDMEPGNPTPAAAGPWAKWQLTQGNPRPCEYSMLSWMPAIRANLAAYGIPLCSSSVLTRCVRLWDANWTNVQHLDSGYFCTQWTDHAFNINLDESTCLTSFYVAPTPKPKPKPKPVKQVCFGRHPMNTPGCKFVQREVAAWRKQAASDLANAARVTKNWS